MKRRIFKDNGPDINTYVMEGLTVRNGTVTLIGNPSIYKEAVNKLYVDTVCNIQDTNRIVSGTLALSTLVGTFSNDARISSDRTPVSNLCNSSGVINVWSENSVAVRFDVSSKGIVTYDNSIPILSVLPASLIPNLDWSKVLTINRPTTASGYGITDALLTGDTNIANNLTLVQLPASNKEAANVAITGWYKSYADGSKISTGDIVFKSSIVTPTGYLRCNGSAVSTTTYASLFAVIGYQAGANPPANTFYLPNLATLEASQYYYYIKT